MKPNLMNDVEEIASDETERILTCAAAVDVAKASGMVCVRRHHPSVEGRRASRVWEVDSTTRSILALGDDLVALGVQRVVLDRPRPRVRFGLLAAVLLPGHPQGPRLADPAALHADIVATVA